jgi:fimbrial chaperone protein
MCPSQGGGSNDRFPRIRPRSIKSSSALMKSRTCSTSSSQWGNFMSSISKTGLLRRALHLVRAIALSAVVGGSALAVSAFSVAPIVLDLEVIGPQSSGQLTVTNPNALPLSVEVTLDEVLLDDNGNVKTRIANSQDFVILPPQDTIQPGQARVFTVQYIGNAEIKESRYFEFGVDQIPLPQADNGQAAVQIVYSIAGILSVAPLETRPLIAITSTSIRTDETGKNRPVLNVRNNGPRHGYLSRGTLRLQQKDARGRTIWRQTYTTAELQQVIGVAVLPANRKREIVVPVDLPSAEGTIIADFTPEARSAPRRPR